MTLATSRSPMSSAGSVTFEVASDSCNLRVELELNGSTAHLYRPLVDLMALVLVGQPVEPSPPVVAPVVEPVPVVAEPSSDVPKPETPVPGPEEPTTYTVDPEPVPEPAAEGPSVTPGGPMAELLALLADAGGELTDADGGVCSKIADLTGMKPSSVSNTLYRLKAEKLVMSTTVARRTTRVVLTLSGWEAAGQVAPLTAVAAVGDGGVDHQQRMRDRAAGALAETPGSGRRFEARR